ncbi:MAG: polysaccharide deacetylase family protein [Segetibacter sp.]|nr:polysaccharide deacetylase family protein [Segetibacter sp.]
MKKVFIPLISLIAISLLACRHDANSAEASNKNNTDITARSTTAKPVENASPKTMADAATILARKEVPVLCYHQIRDWNGGDSKSARDIVVPVNLFKAHLKILADSGYHTILPDQLYDYLTTGAPLPDKPFMLTYDDTDDDQFNIAEPEMKKYGFKGVYFIMTVSINRPKYIKREQVKQLSDEGNVIASHTWDHHKSIDYKTEEDWATQIEKPKKQIEEITGKSASYFAYPYGLWDKKGIPELKKRGIKAAFILSTERDPDEPLFTIRRMIGSGHWSARGLYQSMIKTFHLNK